MYPSSAFTTYTGAQYATMRDMTRQGSYECCSDGVRRQTSESGMLRVDIVNIVPGRGGRVRSEFPLWANASNVIFPLVYSHCIPFFVSI